MGRRLGQHFLTRKSILDRIADAACVGRTPWSAAGPLAGLMAGSDGADQGVRPTPLVIEIGAGRGTLTEALLDRAGHVTAIEIDPILVHYLQHKFRDPIAAGRLELVPGDILKTDLGAWGPCVIAGNLPYYITSPILDRLFAASGLWTRAVFLVQSEVAARIAAEPGSRAYGFLSVTTQIRAHVERLFEVPREAFRPPPKVLSEVIKLVPREPLVKDLGLFCKFIGVCFRQKRKTLRNNLAVVYGKERAGTLVDARVRAEQLSIPELIRLYESCHV